MSELTLSTTNGVGVRRAQIPAVPAGSLADAADAVTARGGRLAAIVPVSGSGGERRLIVVFAVDAAGRLELCGTSVRAGEHYPSLAASLPEAQAFERELWEEQGVVPDGHPWLKPLRRHPELGPNGEPTGTAAYPFLQVAGAGIHEVAVGPVHAGIIEPGHFRFQCRGEEVLNLEIHLGYQRRGVERLMLGGSAARRVMLAESVAGDTSIAHALAHCAALEGLAGVEVPLAAQVVRGVLLELERLANHVGDLGALAGDVGFLPGAAWFGRLRGEFLNMLMSLTGNRMGRGLLVPGGVRWIPAPMERRLVLDRLGSAERDLKATADVMFEAVSVLSRFEGTGVVTRDAAEDLGLVGPIARASGLSRDVRRDHPHGIYRFAIIPVSAAESGDVMARAMVRWLEVQRSLQFVREQLDEFRQGPPGVPLPALERDAACAALVEGWRGEVLHAAVTDGRGELAGYKIVDPSFHNWFALQLALRGTPISDFPLCNKSFNLSYAGHDL